MSSACASLLQTSKSRLLLAFNPSQNWVRMAGLIEVLSGHTLPVAIGTLTFYILYGILYRLCLSPISSFPGPRLVGVTYWYEFYYEVFRKHGQFIFHIRNLHSKYGPVVRINLYELHISTPEFYETLYSSSKKRNKWYWFVKMFGMDNSGFATVDHCTAALNPYFSTASVRLLQPAIEERAGACLERLRPPKGTAEAVKTQVFASAYSSGKRIEGN